MSLKRFLFTVELQGYGETADVAWTDAIEQFSLDSGPVPDKSDYSVEPAEEED